ncbi:MAG: 30S ribosomal protein S20 [Bacteroidetes bacterium]|jgi:small subunit ribosomal protein S20|nr:30S ribosomal protein S20 [Bacteroidota bacterium]MDA8930592.1 30S ribosomal protein S20 [Bacteroidia bacterium]
MANHKSTLKRIRSNEAKTARNKYQHKTARTWIKRVRTAEDKAEAETLLRETFSKVDKLVKKNIIHKNKAANLKSKLAKHVASLG